MKEKILSFNDLERVDITEDDYDEYDDLDNLGGEDMEELEYDEEEY